MFTLKTLQLINNLKCRLINLHSNQKTLLQLLINVLLFFKFKIQSSFINDSSLYFCILILNPSVLKIKQFSLYLYNQKPTNEETCRICRVDVNTITFNHASILAHLLLLTLRTKYKLCHCKLDSINLKGKFIRIWDMLGPFINIVIYQLLL